MTPTISYLTSGLAWLVALSILGGYEWWAFATNHPTLSAFIWVNEGRFPWFRWVVEVVLAVLMWHFWPTASDLAKP